MAGRRDTEELLGAVGPRLRDVRERRRLTLAEVGERTALSVSTLSRLENGARRPTLDLLLPLAELYGVALDDLVGAPPSGDPRVHLQPVRRDGMVYVPLNRGRAPVQAFKLILSGRQDKGAPVARASHGGYEWLYVLRGVVDLALEDEVTTLHEGEVTTLHEGEVAEFDTRRPHGMASGSDMAAELLTLFSSQSKRIHVRDG